MRKFLSLLRVATIVALVTITGLVALLMLAFGLLAATTALKTPKAGEPQELKHRIFVRGEEWLGWAFFTPSASEVIETFRSRGLEVGNTYPLEQEPGGTGIVPKTYEEAIRFEIPSLGRDTDGPKGGRVFVFDSKEDMEVVSNYYAGLNRVSQQAPLFGDSHLYNARKGLVLVQINGELPDDKARPYGEVVQSM